MSLTLTLIPTLDQAREAALAARNAKAEKAAAAGNRLEMQLAELRRDLDETKDRLAVMAELKMTTEQRAAALQASSKKRPVTHGTCTCMCTAHALQAAREEAQP